jgi:Na+/melibiose symporter-like transporter
MPAEAPPRVGLGLQVSYGLGGAALGIGGMVLLPTLLQLFFNQVVGLPAVWVGAAIMATVVLDSITDPLIGLVSDRLRSPLGRRHTLMYLSAVPAALGFYFLWQAPAGAPAPVLLAFMVAMLFFLNVAFSLYEIPSVALAPELAPDYEDRSRLIAWRWLFTILGAAAINVLVYQVYLRQDAANPAGVLNRERWEAFGLVAAGLILVFILASTAATHGRIRRLHAPPAARPPLRESLAEIRTALSHGPMVTVMLAGLFMGFGAGVTFGLSAYFNLHFWGLKPQEMTWLVLGGVSSSGLALFAGPWIGGRFGKKRAIIGLYLAWLVTATVPISLRLMGVIPPNGAPGLLPFLTANYTLGLGLAVSGQINLGSCVADCIDDISVRTGRRSEGLMFAAYAVLDKIAAGGGAFLAGAILSAVAFPIGAAPGSVAPEVLRNLALADLPIVAFFNLASILFLTRYGLTRGDHEKNAAILAARLAHADASPPKPAQAEAAE